MDVVESFRPAAEEGRVFLWDPEEAVQHPERGHLRQRHGALGNSDWRHVYGVHQAKARDLMKGRVVFVRDETVSLVQRRPSTPITTAGLSLSQMIYAPCSRFVQNEIP